MKYGVREICEVVLRAKARQVVGNKVFFKNEPVIYFDTLKTSSLEGAATTVYAQGGVGNSRLIAWEGERTVTFTMEDALISPEGFMILSGAGLIEASAENTIKQHVTETVDASNTKIVEEIENEGEDNERTLKCLKVGLSQKPYLPADKGDNFAYVMLVKDGEIISEPYIPVHEELEEEEEDEDLKGLYVLKIKTHDCYDDSHAGENPEYKATDFENINFDSAIVDYYVERESGKQIEITPDKFGGNYYLEASTLWRDTNGVDLPAEFIIPNCKIQSNFTFTMASTGDPSSFTFTMDAFPDYTRFDHSKKVLAAIQVIDTEASMDYHRGETHVGAPGTVGGGKSYHEEHAGPVIVPIDNTDNSGNG